MHVHVLAPVLAFALPSLPNRHVLRFESSRGVSVHRDTGVAKEDIEQNARTVNLNLKHGNVTEVESTSIRTGHPSRCVSLPQSLIRGGSAVEYAIGSSMRKVSFEAGESVYLLSSNPRLRR